MLFLFGVALKLEPENVAMAYVDQDKSFFSNAIKTGIWSEGYFRLYEVETEQQLQDEIRNGKAKAGLFISNNFSAQLVENAQPVVKIYIDGAMPSLATAMDNESGVITDRAVTNDMYFQEADEVAVVIAQDPFILDIVTLFNPDKREAWFFLPGVIGILIMQVALILTSTAIVREKENHTLEQIIVSPITPLQFVLGKTLPYFFIAFIDFYLVLFLGQWFFDLPPPDSQLSLLLLALLFVISLIALGLAISTVSTTQQQAIFLSIFILIPSILLSGFIFPLEAIPEFIRPICYLLPFTYFTEIVRGLLLKGSDFSVLLPGYLALLGFAVLFLSISTLRFKKQL